MPSTTTTAVAARVPNAEAAELRRLAAEHGRSVSSLVARAVSRELKFAAAVERERRAAAA